MQSSYADISPTLLPATLTPAVSSRSAALSPKSAAVPLSIRKTPYPGIDAVLEAASALVKTYTGDERIRGLALRVTRSVRAHPATGQPDLRDVDRIAGAIYKWMVRTINYVRDPWDIERIQSPLVTLAQKAGDCDDHAILGAALLQSLGVQTGFRIVSRTGAGYDHIYAVYHSPAGWKSFDTTVLMYPGYEFNERLIKKSRHVTNPMPQGLGFEPLTTLSALASTAGTGVSLKNTLSSLFSPGDKPQRQLRGDLRNYLTQRGVHSAVASVAHRDNHVLQRYAQIIDEFGRPAVDHLNRFGSLPDSFVDGLRAKNKNRKHGLYAGILVGVAALTGAGLWALNH